MSAGVRYSPAMVTAPPKIAGEPDEGHWRCPFCLKDDLHMPTASAMLVDTMRQLEMRLDEWMHRMEVKLGPCSKATSAAADSDTRNENLRGAQCETQVECGCSEQGSGDDSNLAAISTATSADMHKVEKSADIQFGDTCPVNRSSDRSSRVSDIIRKERSADLWRKYGSLEPRDRMIRNGTAVNMIAKVVLHDYFDYAVFAAVVVNSLLIGAQVHHDATSRARVTFFDYAEYAFMGAFSVEFSMRACVYGRLMFGKQDWVWTLFDVFLVLSSWVDAAITLSSGIEDRGTISAASTGKILRMIRMVRIMRIIRALRFLGELRVMASMIVHSMMSLFWLFIILVTLIYVFAIILTQGSTSYLKASPEPANPEPVREACGSLFRCMYTLFTSMTSGRNWGEVADVMADVGWLYQAVVIIFIFFTLFSVLNIVTGFFVDSAIELAKRDRSMLLTKQQRAKEASATHLLALLDAIDVDGDGSISHDEFRQGVGNQEVRQLMEALHIDPSDATALFSLLDKNGDGQVDILEFVEGMQQLRGEAKSSDVHILLLQNQRLLQLLSPGAPSPGLALKD